MSVDLPPCGLYRTGSSLPKFEQEVPRGVLVYFHNHSDKGPPIVLLPNTNQHNRWHFHQNGWLVEDPGFIKGLVALKKEGFYVVKGRHLHISREDILPEKTLVQLGYNRKGDTILFPARFAGNAINFPSQGYRFESPDVQDFIAAAGFSVPNTEQKKRTLH